MAANPKETLLFAYHAYNARDVDGLLSMVTPDVDWPNGDERLQGPDELREYWRKQWLETSTHDQPTRITEESDGRYKVFLNQVVRSVAGDEISRGSFEYVFEFRGDKIARLDILK